MTAAPPRPARRRRRVHTPTLLQMEATECGAASLGIVLGYYGRVVPLEELRVACGVSRDGSDARNLYRAAKAYGLVPKGWRKEPDDLRALRLPLVVFWKFNHFLVVEGFAGDKVYLNDPALGPRVVDAAEFDRSFTGIAITFEPGPDFARGGRRPSLLAGLRRRLGRSRAGVAFCVLAGLGLVVPGLAVPALSRTFVDQYLIGGDADWVGAILVGLAGAAVVQLGLSYLQQRVLARLQTKLAVRMSAETVEHLLALPVRFFAQRAPSELAWRASLNDQVAQVLSGQLTQAALALLTVGLYALLMLRYDPVLTAVVLAAAVANGALLVAINRRRKDLSQRQMREQAEVVMVAAGGIALIESVKASGGEGELFERWSARLAKLLEVGQASDLLGLPLTAVPTLLTSLTSAAVLGLGALRVMDGHITLGTLVAFQTLMASFLLPIGLLVTAGGSVQVLAGSLQRLDDILRAPTERRPRLQVREPAGDGLPPAPALLRGALDLRGVTFGYSPLDQPLIDGFELHLAPGQRVALVGGTGSGKSTVSRLVSGLYEPWSGQVLIDGAPRAELDPTALHNGLALVDQDIMLFEGTVWDNLTLWDPGVPEADVVAAARDAAIHDELVARPGGYHGRVDEDGRNFSGGQRQRLEIARALVRGPALMVLDEATSALDALTELTIDQALRRRGCTCLIVAHRLSTVRDSDEIVVLDRGKVVERGTHDELLGRDGVYARLVRA